MKVKQDGGRSLTEYMKVKAAEMWPNGKPQPGVKSTLKPSNIAAVSAVTRKKTQDEIEREKEIAEIKAKYVEHFQEQEGNIREYEESR